MPTVKSFIKLLINQSVSTSVAINVAFGWSNNIIISSILYVKYFEENV